MSEIQLTSDVFVIKRHKTVERVDLVKTKRLGLLLSFAMPVIVMISCMLGVIAIDYFFLFHQSLRLDESQSLWQANHTIPGLLKTVALDVHVPLYHLILHYWILFFGDSVPVIRSLSMIFFLMTIPVVYLIGRQLLTRNWAMFLIVVFSFSPFLLWYSSEARMYTLLLLMSTLSLYFFLKIMNSGKGWLGFTAVALIGAYSHYFFMFTLAAEGIFYLFNRSKFKPGTFKRLILVGFLVMLALSPWLYYFHSLGSASTTRPLLAKPSTVDFSNVFSQFIFGFQDNRINTILLSCWPLLMLVGLMLVIKGKRSSNSSLSLMLSLALIPIVIAYVLSLVVTPFFLSRYMISCVAPLLIAMVWFISCFKKQIAALFASLIVIFSILASYAQIANAATPVKENYATAVGYINSHITPQDLLVLSAPFTIYPVEYYYHGQAQIETLPEWNSNTTGAIPAFNKATMPSQIASQNANHRYIYLLLSQNQGYENTIKQYYLTHFNQIYEHVYSPDLTLYVYKVGYYQVPSLATIKNNAV